LRLLGSQAAWQAADAGKDNPFANGATGPLTPTEQIQKLTPCLRPVSDKRRVGALAIFLPL
jgi:hypothetical protein